MERLKRLRDKANALPLLPGVYIMRNKEGKIIYIGKAKALKNRVVQYFRSGNSHAEKVRRMVENVEDFDYIICDSEFEALILECSLIKQHSPKYNILLKDDKGYHYIHISNQYYLTTLTIQIEVVIYVHRLPFLEIYHDFLQKDLQTQFRAKESIA